MREAPELEPYAAAFLDWLCCATRGLQEPAARAALSADDRVLALGTAGHVLDYDDTYAPGLAHLSVAWTLVQGTPRVESFDRVSPEIAQVASECVAVDTDPKLEDSEAVLLAEGREFRVQAALGSPARPMSAEQLEAKLNDLAGDRFDEALSDLRGPARGVLDALLRDELELSPSAAGARRRPPGSDS